MTTLYRPVLIESAEQAEALPDGVHLVREFDDGRWNHGWTLQHRLDGVYVYDGLSTARSVQNALFHPTHRWRGKLLALVPVEAEEEWEDDGRPVWNIGEGEATPADVNDYERRNGRRPSRRLVTPWEDT